MGTSASTDHEACDVMSQLKEVRREAGGVVVVRPPHESTYLLREYSFACEATFEKELARLEGEVAVSTEHVLAVAQVRTHSFHGLCSTTHKLTVLYQWPQVTLRDEIQARLKEQKRFDEHELWSILQSCNLALAQMCHSLCLSPSLVFITPEGLLKVIHSDLVDDSYRFNVTPRNFYAPQKLRDFTRVDNELGLIRESVFSFGMTLLQAALLEESLPCYDYDQRLFLEHNLKSLLLSAADYYSPLLMQLLQSMLEIDPTQRPVYHQIQEVLDHFWSIQSEDPESSIKGESLNIQQADKKIIFTSQEERPFFRNLATISSQIKQSARPLKQANKLPESKASPQAGESEKKLASIKDLEKENLFTDPKLLQMIRQDLQDISKLKQSTLNETIKYSFLYPQTNSLLGSTTPQASLKERLQRFSDEKQVIIEREKQMKIRESLQKRGSLQKIEKIEVTDEEGRLYQGQAMGGKKHGWGKLLFADGAFYEGEFKQGQIHGRGILYYTQGCPAYDGMWFQGKFHGRGVLYNQYPLPLDHRFNCADFDEIENYWVRYQGDFRQDTKEGKGRLVLSNGEIMEGQFQRDFVHGEGTFIDSQGQQHTGLWHQNRLVSLKQ